MSFKPEVTTAGSDEFVPNGLAFASAEEAQAYVENLADRWTAVTGTRVVPSDAPVNYEWTASGRLVEVAGKKTEAA